MTRILIIAFLSVSFNSFSQELTDYEYSYTDSSKSDYFTNHKINVQPSQNFNCDSVSFPMRFHDLSKKHNLIKGTEFYRLSISKLVKDTKALSYDILVNEKNAIGGSGIDRENIKADFYLYHPENTSFTLTISYGFGSGESYNIYVTDVLNFGE